MKGQEGSRAQDMGMMVQGLGTKGKRVQEYK